MDSLIQGRYRLIEQFRNKPGRQTWLAFDVEKEQRVVLKKLCFDASFEWNALKQFERESKILQNLEHPRIPKFLSFFELESENSSAFILIQSYIEAQSLTAHIQAGRTFTDSDIKQIAASVLDTLSYLHSRCPPVIHRDIKPSNILLSNSFDNRIGQVYLVDFGSVQTPTATGTDTFTIVGSYGYMAPEQFIGRAMPASDLYGLGATLIYLATGRHPADLMTDDFNLDWRESISLSAQSTNWIKQLVEPDLSRRFKNVEEAIEHLKSPPTILHKDSLGVASTRLAQHSLPQSRLSSRYLTGEVFLIGIGTTSMVVSSLSAISFVLRDVPIPAWNLLAYFVGSLIIIGDLSYKSLQSNSHGYSSFAWTRLGEALQGTGNKPKALARYRKYQADALAKLKRYKEAIDKYDRAIELEADYSWTWKNRGDALCELKRYEEAIDSYDRAIELEPDCSWIWKNRGDALTELGRYQEAIESCNRAEAIDSYDRAIKLEPGYS